MKTKQGNKQIPFKTEPWIENTELGLLEQELSG